jgi:acetyltransferase-like isoleucine patch superfamily enzyme
MKSHFETDGAHIVAEYALDQPNVPFFMVCGTRLGHDVVIHPYAVLGREPMGAGNLVRPAVVPEDPLVVGDQCIIGPGAVLYKGTTIGHHTMIGDNTSIRERCTIGHHVVIGRSCTIHDENTIGNYVRITDLVHISNGWSIEDDVLIAAGAVFVNDGVAGHFGDAEPYWEPGIVRHGATIGAGALIMPGVEVGAGSLVASGAVVTRDVPPGKIVMGMPARVFRDVPSEWGERPVRGK